MTPLDQKIASQYAGLVVRKDLVKAVRGNAIVPSYVLEYLLGQYCATSDEAGIQAGIETVKEILQRHYVHRSEAGLVKSTIKEKGRHKVIDKVSVGLNDKAGVYEAQFSNLGINKVLVDSDTVKRNPKLLVSGVWCIADLEYQVSENKDDCPWVLGNLKAIQMANFDLEQFLSARRQFSTEEWIDLLIQSIGFDPSKFGRRSKLIQLVRLVAFCERNYNLIELGPKGTGKSHIYSEFSPHGILISGGEVTVAKLFVNNASGKIGLVGYWDVVTFDEFAGHDKRVDKSLVDILKNYMANKSFSRGVDTQGAEASMSFVGNTKHNLPYMLKHTDLFDELPEKFKDSAFLDRLHHYIPGWEVDILRGDLFSDGYGFVVDYLAEILRHFRNQDFSQAYRKHFELLDDVSTRDRDGIHKTFSGLMKILYPHEEATPDEIEEILRFAIEGRKRVKDQLQRIDSTYAKVRFGYRKLGQSEIKRVRTLEEEQYPHLYGASEEEPSPAANASEIVSESPMEPTSKASSEPVPCHLRVSENQKGISYESLFGRYLAGAHRIELVDPYLRIFYQLRNLMEFLEVVLKNRPDEDDLTISVTTIEDEFKGEAQREALEKMRLECLAQGVEFEWSFDDSKTIHARHVTLDNGWKILLDRGLDIFQPYEMNNAFAFANRLQSRRSCKAFEMTVIREAP